jgi:hypothetical protein
MSNIAQIAIYLAVLAVGWVAYVVWHVLRRRKQHSAPSNADAYEGNLVVPAVASRRHGVFSRRRGVEYRSGSGEHTGTHRGPVGFDGFGPFGGVGHR